MIRRIFFDYLIFALMFFCLRSAAQITLSQTVGCIPFSVNFTPPPGSTGHWWNFGNGNPPSVQQTPNAPYTSAGVYNITYTGVVNGSNVSYTAKVVANGPPSGSMSYILPASHCKPMVVGFSATGGNSGSTYSWAFGDLTPIVGGAVVSHTYNFKGAFTPVVTITDGATGCSTVATASGTIYVSDPPKLLISSSNGFNGCNPPFTTSLDGSGSISGSPLPGPLSQFSWTMNAGSPSGYSGQTPGTTVFQAGTHTISLQASDNNQCSSLTTATINVFDPKLSVMVQPTVCWGAMVQVTVNSTSGPLHYSHTGQYGLNHSPHHIPINTQTVIGTTGPLLPQDTVAIFTNPGPNSFTFEIFPGGQCAPIKSVVPVYVERVIPDFIGLGLTSTCGPSMVATYSSISTVNTSHSLTFVWKIDGGNGTNQGSPTQVTGNPGSFTLTQHNNNPYTIYRNWTPKIWLEATSTSIAGCKAEWTWEKWDTIRRPTAWFETDKKEGCAPLTVTFRDSSFTLININHDPVNPITGYTLYSGGGTPAFVILSHHSLFPVTFTYSSPGTYTPQMYITTQNGCTDWSFVDTIRVVDPPGISIKSISPTGTVCAGTPVKVHLTASPNSSVITNWHVTSDDGFFSGCVSDSMPSYPFTHIGTHGFTVSGQRRGCQAPAQSSHSITVRGPYGSLRYRTTCDPATRKIVHFDVLLQDAESAVLHFGDNTPPVTITGNVGGHHSQVIAHTYSATNNYTASLVSTNSQSGCGSRTESILVTIRELEAKIKLNNKPLSTSSVAIGCTNEEFYFNSSASTAALIGCRTGYLWLFETPHFKMIPSVTSVDSVKADTLFYAPGYYKISLVVTDVNSCSDTEKVHVRISEVMPDFTFNANPFCMSNGSVQIINTTQASQVAPDYMTNYLWDFGNGTLTTTGTDPDPLWPYLVPPGNHIFAVTLTGTNNVGCSGAVTRTLQVNNPYPNLKASAWTPCLAKGTGSVVTFSAMSGYSSYSISYGDPGGQNWVSLSNLNNHPHNYTVPGDYTVGVMVKDAAGCIGIEYRLMQAIGQSTAQIGFLTGVNKFCYPFGVPTLTANVLTNVTPVNSYLWQQDNGTAVPGTSSLSTNVIKGISVFKLTTSTNNFCPSTDTALVIVSDPQATPVLDKNKLCLYDVLNVSLKDTSDVEAWQWFFGDNVLQPKIIAVSPQALFNPTLAYTYSVMPLDSLGKTVLTFIYSGLVNSCVRSATAALQIIDVSAAFKQLQDIYRHCLGSTDAFVSTMRNPAGHNLEYLWDFGDNNSGSGQSVSHLYKMPGQFPVLHKIRERDFGCEEQEVKTMTILPLPTATLDIQPEMICPDIPFDLIGSGTPGVSGLLTGTLQPEVNFLFGTNNTFSVNATAAQTTTYTLKVKDENGCESEADTAIIQVPLRAGQVHWDTLIVIGQPAYINAYTGSNFTYTWTPLTNNLSCVNCYDPISTTTVPLTYTVRISDQPLQCFITENTYEIRINPLISLDVPGAFTPNSDGKNDVIFPGGWGIRNLIYFRIYNRWGQLLFESNDLKVGWDGTYQGIPQNTETYVYQVMVDTFRDEKLSKTGTFKLLR